VLYQNKYLKAIFEHSHRLFESPLSISQLAFGVKEAVLDHVLMIGDTAGLIHPLCGNGMGMAIHSAKICAELLADFFQGKDTEQGADGKNVYFSMEPSIRIQVEDGKFAFVLIKKRKTGEYHAGRDDLFSCSSATHYQKNPW